MKKFSIYLSLSHYFLRLVTKKKRCTFGFLAGINESAHAESLEALEESIASFNQFLAKNKVYEGGSFLSKTELSESVSFINCIEDYQKILVRKQKESEQKARWEKKSDRGGKPAD